MKFYKKLAVSFLFIAIAQFSHTFAAVENSIITLMENLENIQHLPSKKFSQNQYSEIAFLLAQKDEKIRVATFNMLFDAYDHNLDPINRWPQRLPRIVEALADMQADIIGTQELFPHQAVALMEQIGDVYEFYAYPMESSEQDGILYKKERFEVLESNVWGMPPKIDEIDSTLTMVMLKDLKTNKPLAFFNVHLAFSNINAREAQARFIAEKVEEYAQRVPVILTGDMNTFPARQDLEKLPVFDGDFIFRILTSGSLKDAKDLSLLGHVGPISSFTNEGEDPTAFKGTGTPGIFLDHIMVSKEWGVMIHATQPVKVDGHFPSDHLPLIADIINLESFCGK